MTQQPQNQTFDQKKGSADLRTEGESVGLPGHTIADGESRELREVVDDVEGRDDTQRAGRSIPEQPGCGPTVTDYPGLGAPRGTDAQSTGSDA
jgi:hypothetical protein